MSAAGSLRSTVEVKDRWTMCCALLGDSLANAVALRVIDLACENILDGKKITFLLAINTRDTGRVIDIVDS